MSRGRRRSVKALIAVGSFLAFLSVFAIWVERQALNTDDWVQTSDKLIQDKTIRAALSDYLVDQLYANVDVEKEFEEKLPGETKDFAGPLSGVVRSVAADGVEKVLETQTAQNLWEDANRTAHEQLIEVLEDKKAAVSTDEGEVKLQLGSLVTNLADQIGVGTSLAEKLAEVVVFLPENITEAARCPAARQQQVPARRGLVYSAASASFAAE